MLGLAASHLSLGTGTDYKAQALTHRVSAIASLSKALNQPASTKAEADALYATVMALAFQSSYMMDGMLEFISMIRGCVVVSGLSLQRFAESLFQKFSAESHMKNVQALNQGGISPTRYTNFFDAALVSVMALVPLCRSTLELRYIAIIDRVIQAAKSDSVNGTKFLLKGSSSAMLTSLQGFWKYPGLIRLLEMQRPLSLMDLLILKTIRRRLFWYTFLSSST